MLALRVGAGGRAVALAAPEHLDLPAAEPPDRRPQHPADGDDDQYLEGIAHKRVSVHRS